jgi:protease-4
MTVRTILLLIALATFNGCIGVNVDELFNPSFNTWTLIKKGESPRARLVLIDVTGEIGHKGGMLTDGSVSPSGMMEVISAIDADPSIKGIVLRVNSPGGGVAATDSIHHELLALKARLNVPVVVSITGLGCSGAYYLSMVGDVIYAQPSSIVGSIGVIARMPQLGSLARKVGYSEVIVKSGPLKDMGHPLKEMPKDEREIIQGLVDNHFGNFLDAIESGRKGKLSRKKLEALADGRVYTAKDAVANGLIDKLGYLTDAVDDLAKRCGATAYEVISFRRGKNPQATLYAKQATTISIIDPKTLGIVSKPSFQYLWLPGRP